LRRKKEMALAKNTGLTPEQSAIPDLEERLRGELVRPGVSAYDEHRKIWNSSTKCFPALIARA
jgi:hypothetical protein